jgi:hypothetical protein
MPMKRRLQVSWFGLMRLATALSSHVLILKRRLPFPPSSCPDLIRASINLHKSLLAKGMDCRVKPGNDKALYTFST